LLDNGANINVIHKYKILDTVSPKVAEVLFSYIRKLEESHNFERRLNPKEGLKIGENREIFKL